MPKKRLSPISLEELEDIYIALDRLEKPSKRWSLRVCRFLDDELLVLVVRAGHRKDVYENHH